MAERQSQQHRLSQVPAVAVDHNRNLHNGGVAGGICRRVLPEHVPDVAVPGGDVLCDSGADRVHNIRVRGDGQGFGSGRAEPGVPGVLSGGLLGLAGGESGE
ncbi:hypothetical protein QN277_008092 [Acacia crassicarpa]|uniref:Uncharacterized protein n=1 Tax=Acacia crassicarpa TaxID=499986 RepID=A0AAE1M7T8_9FABA|nr:hypothetical protein QN277_008092 [Acacia crassicarpa]